MAVVVAVAVAVSHLSALLLDSNLDNDYHFLRMKSINFILTCKNLYTLQV